MTDIEIKKALECCIKSSHFGECFENKCPLVSENGCKVGKETLYPYALNLINRLQAENERLLQELQYPQADTVQPMSEENIVHCKECKHLMFSDFEGECSKGYKGIVRPNDSCPFGVRERGESK